MPPKNKNDQSMENMKAWQIEVLQRLKEGEETMKEMKKMQDTLIQRLNEAETKLVIETAKREVEIKDVKETVEQIKTINIGAIQERQPAEMIMPTFFGNDHDVHPKQFLRDLEVYIARKKVPNADECIIIGNSLKGKATSWYNMIKDATPDLITFKTLFLKHFFSDKKQWDIFIQCTEAGKIPIESGFQAHFHKWMTELKYLDTPKITEEQGISLVIKHFPIAVQAFLQSGTEKRFLSIWEKLDEMEDHHLGNRVQTIQRNTYSGNNQGQRSNYQNNDNRYENRSQGKIRQINVEDEGNDNDNYGEYNMHYEKNPSDNMKTTYTNLTPTVMKSHPESNPGGDCNGAY